MHILGISCFYHEAAAALIRDGRVVAAGAEERFSGKKHDARFPVGAISMCLSMGNIRARDLDWVVFYEKPFAKFARNITMSMSQAPKSRVFFVESMTSALTEKLWVKSQIAAHLDIPQEKILFVPHHLAHAAAAYYPSPFTQAAVLTLDGVGEWATGAIGAAAGNNMRLTRELRYPHSIGLLYSAFTAYLGFEVNDGEYKVMGMAAYGKPKYTDRVHKLYAQDADGSIRLNADYFSFPYSTTRMYSDKFVQLFAGCDRFDIAASIQKATEEIILTIVRRLARDSGERNLVYGGGVALNSVVNGMLKEKTGFKNVFIFPAAGDDGGAVGGAIYAYHHVLGGRRRALTDVFWGRKYTEASIGKFLRSKRIPHKRMKDAKLFSYITDSLRAGGVVGWFEGRSEFGPRALGHRSILADPRDPRMKDTVNRKIKFREEFRPFAPVVLSRFAKQYYSGIDPNMSPFMLGTFHATAAAKRISPATVHVDGTSRIQTIGADYVGRYRKLLETFYRKTKRPILLNTSLNVKGKPIAETPEDAYRTFMESGIDILVLEHFVIEKSGSAVFADK